MLFTTILNIYKAMIYILGGGQHCRPMGSGRQVCALLVQMLSQNQLNTTHMHAHMHTETEQER